MTRALSIEYVSLNAIAPSPDNPLQQHPVEPVG
jgi:hypothetical protein